MSDVLCYRCLTEAGPDNGGCPHDDLCARCAWRFCRECEEDAADALAESNRMYDRENGAA